MPWIKNPFVKKLQNNIPHFASYYTPVFLKKQAPYPSGHGAFKGCIWEIAWSTSSGEKSLRRIEFISVVTLGFTASRQVSLSTEHAVEKSCWKYPANASPIPSSESHKPPSKSLIL